MTPYTQQVSKLIAPLSPERQRQIKAILRQMEEEIGNLQAEVHSARNGRAMVQQLQREGAQAGIGRIKFYKPLQQYGFIVPEDGTSDYFFHNSAVVDGPLSKGEVVAFFWEIDKEGRKNCTSVWRL